MNYVVGVDCGGTKTEVSAYSTSGELLMNDQMGFGNLVVDYKKGLANIKEALDAIFKHLPKENCLEITLGIAGIDSGGLFDKVMADLASYQKTIHLVNDGKLAHYALLKAQDGITVTAGTGSVILGLSNNKWYRVGGWGQLFGDKGSAYFIAKRGIQQALKEYDMGLEPSDFSLAVFAYFEAETVFELTQRVYSLKKGEIAGLARVIADLEEDDSCARQIIIEAGNDLASGILQIINKMSPLKTPIKIGLNGSVVEKNKGVLKALKERLDQEKVDYQLLKKEDSCTKGAYYLKKRNDETCEH